VRNFEYPPLLVAALAAVALAACQMPRSEPATPQPKLARHVQPYADDLGAAGIDKIVAWSERPEQPVQVLGRNGAIYFPWRRGLPFATFAIDVGRGGATVRADGYSDADDVRFAAAIDFAVRESIRLARDHNAQVEERERARH
jgi:hypothetical protein